MVLEIEGNRACYDKRIAFLKESGVEVLDLEKRIVKDEERCYHCSAWSVVCPSGAIPIHRETLLVAYDPERCIVCELWCATCPPRAMQVEIRQIKGCASRAPRSFKSPIHPFRESAPDNYTHSSGFPGQTRRG